MDPRIAEYIRANRGRYTREAIRAQLMQAGYRPEEIDATWDELATAEPMIRAGTNLTPYVWIVFVLGALLIAATIPGLYGFGVGWLVAYLILAGLAARVLARERPGSSGGVVAMVIMAPIIFLLIGGGICVATAIVVLSTGIAF